MPTDEDEQREVRVDELKKDIPRDPDPPVSGGTPKKVSKNNTPTDREEEAQRLENAKSRQDVAFRSILFWLIAVTVIVGEIFSGYLMLRYMRAVNYLPDARIMIGWFSASVAQLVGLLIIVTRSVFPKQDG